MKVPVFTTTGSKDGEIELPLVFSTPIRNELIHKAYVHLESHSFQRQGRYPNAGMDVVAESNSPPTGHHQARVARMAGGGGGRRCQRRPAGRGRRPGRRCLALDVGPGRGRCGPDIRRRRLGGLSAPDARRGHPVSNQPALGCVEGA